MFSYKFLLFSHSVLSDSLRPHGLQNARCLSIFWTLLKLRSVEPGMPSSHLILCRPLLLPPLIFPSIRVFSSESALLIRWPQYRSFSFGISPSNDVWSCLILSSVHGVLQARILEWVAIFLSKGFSQPRNQTGVSCIADRFFIDWVMREAYSIQQQ